MPSIEAEINYFINKKFGILTTAYPALANWDKDKNTEVLIKIAEIEDYKNVLRSMPVSTI